MSSFEWTEPSHSGWQIKWIGSNRGHFIDRFIGYWIAKNGEKRLYSSTGGVVDAYELGNPFNGVVREGWPYLDSWSTEAEREEVKQRALVELENYIDADARL